ncbi:hypothetical protein [Tenacibaculum piscium]|uniref:hypothetical protein n=1 Tax=Tenacibaculum piscium TaxID=1458515 RepID=UPI001F235E4A|nr:hypothetical protein [Tenacibaculum piscium]
MKKIITIALFLFAMTSFSQEDSFWDTVRFGGSFDLSLGGNNTSVGVSPSAVYDFNEEFSIGGSLGYLHNKSNNYSANMYSVSIIGLYRPINYIEFSSELSQSYINKNFNNNTIKNNDDEKYSYPALNLGVAYIQGKITLGVQYNVLHKENKSIQANAFSPFVRVFF